MKRVAFFIPSLSDGGAQKQCVALLNKLQEESSVAMTLIVLKSGIHDHLLSTANCRIYHLDQRSNYDPRIVLRVVRIVRKERINLLVSWLHASDIYSAVVRRLVPDIAWIMTERDSSYPRNLRFRLRERLARGADAIVSNSSAGDAYWSRLAPKRRRYVVNNIAPSVRVQNPLTPTQRGTVIFVGRFEAQKNVWCVAQSFVHLAQRRPDLDFMMVGQGSMHKEISEYVLSERMSHRVVLTGFKAGVLETIAKARVLVNVSHHEGTPNTVVEAIACGVTVVASKIPEHVALLGPKYPFYPRDFTDSDHVSASIEAAYDQDNASHLFDHARGLLRDMEADAVSRSYLKIFDEVVTR